MLFSSLSICAPLPLLAQTTQAVPADAQAASQPGNDAVPPPTPSQEEPEVMTRGPVHEAYATPVDVEPESKSFAATKAPPAALKEMPPAERPDGSQYVWVPGYWAWDTDRVDYIWVSACWRVAPPNMYWVPGYWRANGPVWEWVPGFWAQNGSRQIEYLPAPPAPIVVEAVGVAPSPNYTWVPPCYYWVNGSYVLRNGYWLEARPGWLWMPSHTVWTPRGYVFVGGYWDFPVERRGVLFCPVYVSPAVAVSTTFVFTPSVTVNIGFLTTSLFVAPRYCHYYFGDYYDPVYINIGIYSWCDPGPHRRWCDPIWDHEYWRHRNDHHWERDVRHHYEQRRDNRDLRPARNYRDMERQLASVPAAQRDTVRAARPLGDVVKDRTSGTEFRRMSESARERVASRGESVQRFGEQRTEWEGRTTHGTVERVSNRGRQDENGNGRGNVTTIPGNNRDNDSGRPGVPTRPTTGREQTRVETRKPSSEPTRPSTSQGTIPTRGSNRDYPSMPGGTTREQPRTGETTRATQPSYPSGGSTGRDSGWPDRQRVPSPPITGRSSGRSEGVRQPSMPTIERQVPDSSGGSYERNSGGSRDSGGYSPRSSGGSSERGSSGGGRSSEGRSR
ncbi:hypothetical protein IT570_12180 [Candidatus Sumerlaeota bacterium]|nr:hypothetical protein [Candidatus Sumerlaeota bacterium]